MKSHRWRDHRWRVTDEEITDEESWMTLSILTEWIPWLDIIHFLLWNELFFYFHFNCQCQISWKHDFWSWMKRSQMKRSQIKSHRWRDHRWRVTDEETQMKRTQMKRSQIKIGWKTVKNHVFKNVYSTLLYERESNISKTTYIWLCWLHLVLPSTCHSMLCCELEFASVSLQMVRVLPFSPSFKLTCRDIT
jgi:hypothetical protein